MCNQKRKREAIDREEDLIVKPWYEHYVEKIRILVISYHAAHMGQEEIEISERDDVVLHPKFKLVDFLFRLDAEKELLEIFDMVADFKKHLSSSLIQYVLNDSTRSQQFRARILLEYLQKEQLAKEDFVKVLKQVIALVRSAAKLPDGGTALNLPPLRVC